MKINLIAGAIMATTFIAGLTSSAEALEVGRNSPYDFRIKSVVYNPVNVVRVDAIAGVATHIVVSPDEGYVTHAFGDSESWQLSHVDNNYFIKPKAANSDTNLIIVTTKRTYNIVLHYIAGKEVKGADGAVKQEFIKTPWSVRQATLQLTYLYPFEDLQKANKKLEKNRADQALKNQMQGPFNIDYTRSDEKKMLSIAPTHVWDNYRFTWIEFPRNANLPTIYVIGPDGKERATNATPAGKDNNILQVPEVAREFHIRYGDKVVAIVNNNYNPSLGPENTGTSSGQVKRVLKGSVEEGEAQ